MTEGITPVRYGDPAFFLYPGKPADALRARTAAMLVAAECWAADGDDLPARLANEVGAARLVWEINEEAWYDRLVWPKIAEEARLHALRGIERSDQ